MRRADNRIQFRASDRLRAFLARRAGQDDPVSPDIQAKTDLDALQALISAELRRIPLTTWEAQLLAGLVDGRQPTPGTAVLYVECRDALAAAEPHAPGPGHQNAGGITAGALLAKLERLGPAADFALCDALASWRARNLEPTAEGFTQAGLRISAGAAASLPGHLVPGATAA
jgi:hypothetical protein